MLSIKTFGKDEEGIFTLRKSHNGCQPVETSLKARCYEKYRRK
jgi:hypothetical protein